MKGEIRDFRDSEKEKFGNGGKQERRISGLGDSGKEKYRKGEIFTFPLGKFKFYFLYSLYC